MASAWGPHLQQVVAVPVSASGDSGGGQKLPCALPGCHVVLSPFGCQEDYRWDRGARYILHLFRRLVVGLAPAWWGFW